MEERSKNYSKEDLLKYYKEGSEPYNNLKAFLDSNLSKPGSENLLRYIHEQGDHRITRWNKSWVEDLRKYFENTPDEYVKDSIEHLSSINDNVQTKLKKAKDDLEKYEMFSEEWRNANELFSRNQGLKHEEGKTKKIKSSGQLLEELGNKLLGDIKERYGWTQELQDGYWTYNRLMDRLGDSGKSSGNLEKIISGIFIFSFLVGLFLSLSETGLTGNVIGSSGSFHKLIGIILVLFGIGGFFVYRKLK